MKATDRDLREMVRLGTVNTTTCLDDEEGEEREVVRNIAQELLDLRDTLRCIVKVVKGGTYGGDRSTIEHIGDLANEGLRFRSLRPASEGKES